MSNAFSLSGCLRLGAMVYRDEHLRPLLRRVVAQIARSRTYEVIRAVRILAEDDTIFRRTGECR
jgi:hypothetical protein